MTTSSPDDVFADARRDDNSIFEAVQAMKPHLGISQGSVVWFSQPLAAYDFYKLLRAYLNDAEARQQINAIVLK